MEFVAVELGSMAYVARFQLLLLRRITKHERFADGGGCVHASPHGLTR